MTSPPLPRLSGTYGHQPGRLGTNWKIQSLKHGTFLGLVQSEGAFGRQTIAAVRYPDMFLVGSFRLLKVKRHLRARSFFFFHASRRTLSRFVFPFFDMMNASHRRVALLTILARNNVPRERSSPSLAIRNSNNNPRGLIRSTGHFSSFSLINTKEEQASESKDLITWHA